MDKPKSGPNLIGELSIYFSPFKKRRWECIIKWAITYIQAVATIGNEVTNPVTAAEKVEISSVNL